jgi:hypothetical protein
VAGFGISGVETSGSATRQFQRFSFPPFLCLIRVFVRLGKASRAFTESRLHVPPPPAGAILDPGDTYKNSTAPTMNRIPAYQSAVRLSTAWAVTSLLMNKGRRLKAPTAGWKFDKCSCHCA